jgi:uncharacterized membrane protein (UPF0127 family)
VAEGRVTGPGGLPGAAKLRQQDRLEVSVEGMAEELRTEAGTLVARRLIRPRGFLRHHLGLLLHPPLEPDEALWLDPCGSIHTWGMAYAIDVLFVDPAGRVLKLALGVKPWRVVGAPRGCRSVIELRAGVGGKAEVGTRLALPQTPVSE